MGKFRMTEAQLALVLGQRPAEFYTREIVREAVEMAYDMGVLKGMEPGAVIPVSGPNVSVNESRHIAVDQAYYLNMDMSTCPRNVKVQLLGQGGVLAYSEWHGFDGDGTSFWRGWAPLPKIPPGHT